MDEELGIGSLLGIVLATTGMYIAQTKGAYQNAKEWLIDLQLEYKNRQRTLEEFDRIKEEANVELRREITFPFTSVFYGLGERIARRRFEFGEFDKLIKDLSHQC